MKEISFDGFGDDYGSNFGRRKFYVPPACVRVEVEVECEILCASYGNDVSTNSCNFRNDVDDLIEEAKVPLWSQVTEAEDQDSNSDW